MKKNIGIRYEDKYVMERRVALPPKHIEKLIKDYKLNFFVESSDKRVFKDQEYTNAGATVTDNLNNCPVIFGVKEMPVSYFEPEKTYIFFSHTIKGQEYNMPMLKKMMELKCNLIDYERIVDEKERRLIFFGRYAGLAGMINSLWCLGIRLKYFGYNTPFLKLKQSHLYDSLEQAKKNISEVSKEIKEKGIPKELLPLVIGFAGYGNVSNGAQEIVDLLPVKEISPEELLKLKDKSNLSEDILYKVVFKEEHLFEPIDSNKKFELQDYFTNPKYYKSKFEKYIPYLTILMNCIYWTKECPKIITKDYLEKLYSDGNPKLTVIGDITCDPNGSIECTYKGTKIEDPVFVYNPMTREHKMGYKGNGLLIMAVDILPSELPRESSVGFGDALINYIEPIASADYNLSFEKLILPKPIKKALILHKGNLTPDYKYIAEFL